jgi:cell division inhibitor SulA
MKIDPYLSPCIKLKSKWIKNLNIKPDKINLIEEKVNRKEGPSKDRSLRKGSKIVIFGRLREGTGRQR